MTQLMLVHSRAKEGREADYVAWYTGTHIGEVTRIAGFHSGTFNACKGPDGQPTGQFAALYEVSDEDPAALMARLMDASGTFAMTDAMDASSLQFTFLSPA